jgi:creatinine amidohydrolase/Fe(II)-dependent formamide hydrolase-like protein
MTVRTLGTPALAAACLAAGFLIAQAVPSQPPQPKKPAGIDDPRPIAAADTVFVEEMTWMEVRDALRAGKTTAIVPTGGVEQNGPYVATGKHNYILRATTDSIARKLGDALVAPVVAFVPEGGIDPPTGHMQYPGTISLTEDTFARLLTDVCSSLRAHGFREVVLVGDSGGNQKGMRAVAAALNKAWAGGKTRVHFIPEYYNHDAVDKWLAGQGIKEVPEGYHDSFNITATLAAVDPVLIRARQRQAAGKFSINGVTLAPLEKTAEWGKKIIEFRSEATVKAIRKAVAEPRP